MPENRELSAEQFLDKLRNFTGAGILTDNLDSGRMELKSQGPDGIDTFYSPNIYQMSGFSADRFISQVTILVRGTAGRITKQILK